jgi:hypothetical protein
MADSKRLVGLAGTNLASRRRAPPRGIGHQHSAPGGRQDHQPWRAAPTQERSLAGASPLQNHAPCPSPPSRQERDRRETRDRWRAPTITMSPVGTRATLPAERSRLTWYGGVCRWPEPAWPVREIPESAGSERSLIIDCQGRTLRSRLRRWHPGGPWRSSRATPTSERHDRANEGQRPIVDATKCRATWPQ